MADRAGTGCSGCCLCGGLWGPVCGRCGSTHKHANGLYIYSEPSTAFSRPPKARWQNSICYPRANGTRETDMLFAARIQANASSKRDRLRPLHEENCTAGESVAHKHTCHIDSSHATPEITAKHPLHYMLAQVYQLHGTIPVVVSLFAF